ncbi:MAG: sigma-70 family RNA polymerase sigma factor [Eubacterium sp.]|nr:sigma-70 family RNA polymerase sigma factor [Eubacterium sp.]
MEGRECRTSEAEIISQNELVLRAKDREEAAFSLLMKNCARDMYRVAISILLNDEDAADAIQETMLTCWKELKKLREPRYFKTWMTRILINKSYAILNTRKNMVPLEEAMLKDRPYEEPNRELKEMLSLLEETYRVPMMLYYGEGYKSAEIAEILNISESAVRTRLQRGREKLKTALEAEEAI